MGKFERISAFMDGELDPSGHEQVVGDLLSDRDARAAWARYHVIGDILRQDSTAGMTMGLADRVRSSIDLEPTVLSPRKPHHKLVRPAIGFAIAASVATIAVIGAQQYQAGRDSQMTLAQEGRAAENAVPIAALQPPPTPPARAERSPRESYLRDPRLNSYLVNFNEQRSSLGVPGVHPYVRIVGFEAE